MATTKRAATKKTAGKAAGKKGPAPSVRKSGGNTPKAEALGRAHLIVKYTHDSARAFMDAFRAVRERRGATVGTSTDEEQDLLRAMLVMTAAGLDGALKQIIRDTLPAIVNADRDALAELETFVSRQLRGEVEPVGAPAPSKFLARVLVAKSQQSQVIEEYILDLTGSSLQSADELFRAAKALGVKPAEVAINKDELKPIFQIRNKIIHELDINFDHVKRNRQTRSQKEMCKHANRLLEIGEKLIAAVDSRLRPTRRCTGRGQRASFL
ncbi:MAG TPA: hypothetical protein VMT00_03610 [Thermoanaerobaculia bacterium]|nr:hypothetical protein [Thermoanaerobaculia bacterium]